jgi:hypothetical protein
MRLRTPTVPLLFGFGYILASQSLHEVGMLGQDALLERLPFLAGHRRHIQRISLGSLGRRLLQLAPIDQLDVRNGFSSSFAGILIVQSSTQSGENSGPIVV